MLSRMDAVLTTNVLEEFRMAEFSCLMCAGIHLIGRQSINYPQKLNCKRENKSGCGQGRVTYNAVSAVLFDAYAYLQLTWCTEK
jgi:hypothetical protein